MHYFTALKKLKTAVILTVMQYDRLNNYERFVAMMQLSRLTGNRIRGT